ncbi:MAG: GNAT family N-acetyltransferase [Cyclobacteriaceae bacterium]
MVLGTEIAHNFHLHAYAIPSRTSGMEVLHGNSLTQTLTGLASDTFNIVYISNGNRLTLPEMKEVIAKYNGHPFTVWVNEQEMIKKVRAILKASGLTESHEEPGMLLELDAYEPVKIKGEIIKAKSEEDFKYIGKNLSRASSPIDKEVVKYYDLTSDVIINGLETEFYIYKVEGKPAAVVEVFPSSSETVGIYNLSVEKSHRKKGIGTELMQFILNQLKEKEYKYAVLQAEESALKIYENLGFRELTRFYEYQ